MRAVGWAVGLVMALAGSAAAQQPDPAPAPAAGETAEEREARELYEAGVKLYDIADYDAAIEKFKAAYKISSAPLLLYNIAQAYRLKGDCRQALQFYKNYLRNDPTGPQAAKAERRLPEMEACAAKQPAGDATPPAGDATPPAGDATPPIGDDIEPPAATNVAPAPRRIEDRPPSRPRPGRLRKLAGLVTAGLGVAAIATGIYFGLQAQDAADRIAALYDNPGLVNWNLMYESVESRGARDERLFIAFTIAGSAAVIGGGVLWYLGWRADRAATTAVTVAPTAGGAAAVWTGTF